MSLVRIVFTLLSYSFTATVLAFDISEDITGSSDYQDIERFARSKIVGFTRQNDDKYRLALGTLKTVNGVLTPEYERRVQADITRITYQIPKGERSDQVFEHFKRQVKNLKADILFECHGRDCGSSNHWANNIFGVANLYGRDRYQHYLAAKAQHEGNELALVVYSIQRGNRRLYTQLDILETSAEQLAGVRVNPATLLQKLKREKRLLLTEIDFDNAGQLTESGIQNLSAIAAVLAQEVRLNLYVVGHYYQGEGAKQMLQQSLQRAQQVSKALVELGVSAERISAQGVGPFSPMTEGKPFSNRVELVITPQ